MPFKTEPAYTHGQAQRTAILLCNLGTPDAPTAKGRLRIGFLLVLVTFFARPRLVNEDTLVHFLQYLTPEGIVRATLFLVPLESLGAVLLLSRTPRRSSTTSISQGGTAWVGRTTSDCR